jgi:hypothetical protein
VIGGVIQKKRRSQVQVTFGKHVGKSVELLMLKEPAYIKWVLDQQSPTGAMAKVKLHIQQLIQVFDKKSFAGKQCWAETCVKPATRFSVYLGNLDPCWWCNTCDEYQRGANPGKLQTPINYQSALQHVKNYCKGRKSDYTGIIKMISQAKGLPSRVSETKAQEFFCG